jgi:hypothetical protein
MTIAAQTQTWPDLFRRAIEHVGPRLSLVLDLADCRERWLQAEMYFYLRRLDPAFEIGRVPIGRNSKADFYGESPTKMIAELKVLGSGYLAKCFDGTGKIPECYCSKPVGTRVPVTAEHLDNAQGYFLHDVNRLRSVPGEYSRLMILVVDRRPPVDRLGQALMAVQISPHELTVESTAGDWIVRIWTV